jgi:hypothetical protein
MQSSQVDLEEYLKEKRVKATMEWLTCELSLRRPADVHGFLIEKIQTSAPKELESRKPLPLPVNI